MQNMSNIHVSIMCTSSSKTAAKYKFRTEVKCRQYITHRKQDFSVIT